MRQIISKSLELLLLFVIICCVIYPAALWAVGQTLFPDKANGSMVKGPDGAPVGSLLIAQPFTKDEYFQPRPSACAYDGSSSSSSALAASNYALRGRVAATLGPIAAYQGGPKDGKPAAPDIEAWFQKDQYQGGPNIVAQWADAHNGLAQAWVGTTFDAKNPTPQQQYVLLWEWAHGDIVAKFKQDNPAIAEPQPSDLAVVFFQTFSKENPGRFPSAVTANGPDGKPVTKSSRSKKARIFNRTSSTCGGRSIRTSRFRTSPATW